MNNLISTLDLATGEGLTQLYTSFSQFAPIDSIERVSPDTWKIGINGNEFLYRDLVSIFPEQYTNSPDSTVDYYISCFSSPHLSGIIHSVHCIERWDLNPETGEKIAVDTFKKLLSIYQSAEKLVFKRRNPDFIPNVSYPVIFAEPLDVITEGDVALSREVLSGFNIPIYSINTQNRGDLDVPYFVKLDNGCSMIVYCNWWGNNIYLCACSPLLYSLVFEDGSLVGYKIKNIADTPK